MLNEAEELINVLRIVGNDYSRFAARSHKRLNRTVGAAILSR